MEMWLFLVIILFFPSFMLIWSMATKKGRPKKPQWWIGYRTKRAMKNQETWIFAQRYSAKLDMILCSIMILGSLIGAAIIGVQGMLVSMSEESIWIMILIWLIGQVIVLSISIIFTERALKKVFNKNGERK